VPVHTQRLGKAELSPPLPSLIHGIVRTVVHNTPRLSTTLAWLSTVALRGVTRRHRVFGHIEERSLSLGLRVTEPAMRCPFQIIPSVWEPALRFVCPHFELVEEFRSASHRPGWMGAVWCAPTSVMICTPSDHDNGVEQHGRSPCAPTQSVLGRCPARLLDRRVDPVRWADIPQG
jgi:hypothetical protein